MSSGGYLGLLTALRLDFVAHHTAVGMRGLGRRRGSLGSIHICSGSLQARAWSFRQAPGIVAYVFLAEKGSTLASDGNGGVNGICGCGNRPG